ncbi:MAG: hypothetical protein J6O00_11215 [Clostridiales bacterium]|nr:hypothetical protein [Clostridiales bacterium]
MRNFDNWIRYQDNDRNPLHGCIQFNVKDGNTVAPIYDSDGTALANPQVTDMYGRTKHQVFIDTDVVAYFYKYVGEGVWSDEHDIDTSDVSKWALQYTTENMLDVLANITSDTVVTISTVERLRAVDIDGIPMVDSKKTVTLLGYFESGDKEPINYIWNPESTERDNGGSVIASDNHITGRWIMVQPTEHVDSRHFGAFPSNSMNMQDQTYQIGQLFDYCSVHSLRPFFNGSTDYRWFKYTNLNVIADAIDISEGTRFMDLGNNTINGDWNGDPFFNLSNTNVVAKNVKASWSAKSYTGYKNVILDRISAQKNWQDANIDVQYSPCYGYNFNHCVISENGNIGSDNANGINNTFVNCKLNERMFVTSGDYKVSLVGLTSGCQFDMDDFRNNMWLYKQLRFTSDSNTFLDYRDMPDVGAPFVDYTGNKVTSETVWVTNLKNLYTTRYTLDNADGQITTYVLENCVGYYQIPDNMTVSIVSSSVKLRLGHNCVINARGSDIMLDDYYIATDDTNPTISVRNCTLQGEYTGNYRCKSFTSYDSILSCGIESMNTVIKDSQINSTLRLIAEPGTPRDVTHLNGTVSVSHFIHGYLDNNIFNAVLIIDGMAANTIFGASHVLVDSLVIQNNRSNLPNTQAWSISRLGCMESDALNYYTFVNNTGGFECSTEMHQVPIVLGAALNNDSYNGMLTETTNHVIESIRWAQPLTGTTEASYADQMTDYFTKMRMFVIGLYDTTVHLQFELIDNPGPGGQLQARDTLYVNPNANYVSEGDTVYNYTVSINGPSVVNARLSTYSKYQDGTIDNTHRFIVPDIARDPNTVTDEWQIRNFILGNGPGWLSGKNVNCSLRIRQLDKF